MVWFKQRLAAAALLVGTATTISIAQSVSIMPLGDSITDGNSYGGYRPNLATGLVNHGYNFAFVGSRTMTAGGAATILQAPHDGLHFEGHPGWRIDQLNDNLLGNTNVDDQGMGGYWLNGGHGTGRTPVSPQFITVLAGINDINQNYGAHTTTSPMSAAEIEPILQSRMIALVGTLTTQRPDAQIMLGSTIPYANGLLDDRISGANAANRDLWGAQDGVNPAQELGVNHYVILFDKWMRDTFVPAQQAAGKHVHYVDLYSNFILPDGSVRGWNANATNGPEGYADFGLHPNQFGYNLMGDTWAKAIESILPEPTSFALLAVASPCVFRRRRRSLRRD